VDMTGNQDKDRGISRSMALLTLIIALLCVLAMARHTDSEIKRANQAAQEAEARSADIIIKLAKVKDMYMRKLEALRDCNHGD